MTLGLQRPSAALTEDGERVTIDSPARIFLAGLYCASEGLLLARLLAVANIVRPSIVPTAAIATGAAVAGSMTYALRTPVRNTLQWGPALDIGLWGLTGLSAVSYFFPGLAGSLDMVETLGALVVFCGLTVYDFSVAINDYTHGRGDALAHSMNIHLDSVSLFARIVRAMLQQEIEKKKKEEQQAKQRRFR
eukprot:TRINITY_DN3202_c0_g1_i2.p1 TRINITY_DN3202_c0_g1~~TRINITY_DN3202_c0_g1_i2.p1  ORF type:complete len:191 (-),score=48.69 TRINITY_DN3202_c0_g1_i2:11-583(-)